MRESQGSSASLGTRSKWNYQDCTTAKETTKKTPIRSRHGSSTAEVLISKALTLHHKPQQRSRFLQTPIPLPLQRRQFARSGVASDVGQLPPPALTRAVHLGQEPSLQTAPSPQLRIACAVSGLQYQAQRRSIYFLPPATSIFAFKLENNILFFHSGLHTLMQTLYGHGRHFEYFLCEHSVPGHFLPQGTVYLI